MKLIEALTLGIGLLAISSEASIQERGRNFPFLPISTGSSRPFSLFTKYASQPELDALAVKVNALQEALRASLKPS